jgi:hypothetical protein
MNTLVTTELSEAELVIPEVGEKKNKGRAPKIEEIKTDTDFRLSTKKNTKQPRLIHNGKLNRVRDPHITNETMEIFQIQVDKYFSLTITRRNTVARATRSESVKLAIIHLPNVVEQSKTKIKKTD